MAVSVAPAAKLSVPLLDLKAQYASIRDEVREALDRVIESQHFILGPEVEAFEAEFASYCQCRFGVGVSSGTDALLAALMAIDLRPGDEVITTPFSFFATAGAIARLRNRILRNMRISVRDWRSVCLWYEFGSALQPKCEDCKRHYITACRNPRTASLHPQE